MIIIITGKLIFEQNKNRGVLRDTFDVFYTSFGLLRCFACTSHRLTESSESSYESDANGERESRISGAFLIGRQSVLVSRK